MTENHTSRYRVTVSLYQTLAYDPSAPLAAPYLFGFLSVVTRDNPLSLEEICEQSRSRDHQYTQAEVKKALSYLLRKGLIERG
jgi:hypothetical protein